MTAHLTARSALAAVLLLALAALAYGSWHNPEFWRTASQRGDVLMAQQSFKQAADSYTEPWQIGTAQYRDGDFETAAHTFAHVPGATGAYNQGNAWLMHGEYLTAIESYDRALGFRPGWQDAIDNKALAAARQKQLEDAGENGEQESAGAFAPDDIVFDKKSDDSKSKPLEMNDPTMSDAELRATWLRRVQTSPGDFLRAKFAYQAAYAAQQEPSVSDGGAQ